MCQPSLLLRHPRSTEVVGFEIWGTGCQNFSGVKQAIEWAKNTTSGRQPFSDRDTFLKRRPELIMHVVPLPKVLAAF